MQGDSAKFLWYTVQDGSRSIPVGTTVYPYRNGPKVSHVWRKSSTCRPGARCNFDPITGKRLEVVISAEANDQLTLREGERLENERTYTQNASQPSRSGRACSPARLPITERVASLTDEEASLEHCLRSREQVHRLRQRPPRWRSVPRNAHRGL